MSLLVLIAATMKVDGKVMRSELDYVREFLRTNFGEEAAAEAAEDYAKAKTHAKAAATEAAAEAYDKAYAKVVAKHGVEIADR